MGCTFPMGEIWLIDYFVTPCLLARSRYYLISPNRVYFDCKTKLCPIVPGRHGK